MTQHRLYGPQSALTARFAAGYNAPTADSPRPSRTDGHASPKDGAAMLHRSSQFLCAWFLWCDLLLTAGCWLLAYYLRFESGWVPVTKPPPEFGQCVANLPLVLLLAGIAYRLTGQYRIDRLRRLREEVISVCKGTALMSLLVI